MGSMNLATPGTEPQDSATPASPQTPLPRVEKEIGNQLGQGRSESIERACARATGRPRLFFQR